MRSGKMCQVLRELRDVGPATRSELSVRLEVCASTMWHWVALLASWGLIRPNGFRGRETIYELAPRGEPLGTPYCRTGTLSVGKNDTD